MDRFELLYSGKVNNLVPVYKYKSKQTGLHVAVAQVEGPLVNGFFCLATEAHDDDGLPHTLEHLIFLGSEQYPYKGVLDIVANRCLASGTNAWTDTDHTCYTTTHAGSTGFLNLMPVYLDHVLYPTITESGYITEVHHINEEGEDAGVVYCEMQACENGGENRCHTAMLRELYPGKCGYKSVTGGVMWNLRESTSHQKVMDYHREYYRPENLSLIITGKIEPEEVLQALEKFEDKILSKGSRPAYERPWQSPVPPLSGSIVQNISYSSDDEQYGMVYVAWRGPVAKDQYTLTACAVLLEYLCDTVVAPLQRDMVEIEHPYCNRVNYSIIENSETCLYVSFHNVPKVKLNECQDKLNEVLTKISTGGEKFDMKRLTDLIHKKVLELASNLEDRPHDTLAFILIGDLLYGKNNEELLERLGQTETFKKLSVEPESYWVDLVTKFMVDAYSVTIVGNPSLKLMETMGEKEKSRIKEQQNALGAEGLKKKGQELEKATQINEQPAPDSVLLAVDVPSVASIQFHTIKPSCNHSNNKTGNTDSNDSFPLADIPVAFQLDNIQSNFATMNVLMNTTVLPAKLKPYLQLFVELLDESAVLRDGVLIPHDDIVKQIAAETVHCGASLGIGGGRFSCGSFSELVSLNIKVELSKYERGISWLHELLTCTQFTAERVKVVATKIVNDVAQLKRSGRFVTKTLIMGLIFNKDCNHHTISMLRQHKFLSDIVTKLADDTQAAQVIADLNELRSILTSHDNITIHHAVHVESLLQTLPEPQKLWKTMITKETPATRDRVQLKADSSFVQPFDHPVGKIVGIGSVETSFLTVVTPCIDTYEHKDLAALMVYVQYLTQLEGPMWRQIRGLGLAYHYSMVVKPETGLLYLVLARATHVVNAYKQAKDIIESLIKSGEFSIVEFESCKSSLVFEIIEEQKTPADASTEGLLAYCRDVSYKRNRELIDEVSQVTTDDLLKVGAKYLLPLFDKAKSKCAVCCHPTKVQEISTQLKAMGRELDVLESLESSFLSE